MRDPTLLYFSPLKAMEYLAAGRPTVVAVAGDLVQLVARGAALGYRPGDATSLAGQLTAVALSAQLRTQLSAAALTVAAENTWPMVSRRVLAAVPQVGSRSLRRPA
jgi:glycosyltransferase involved in cell wall biosynthesis